MRDDECVGFVMHGYTAPQTPHSKPASPLRLQMRLHARVSDSNAVHMTAPVAWSTPLAAVRQTLNTCTHTHTNTQLETLTDDKCKVLSLNVHDKVKLFRPSHT